MSKRIVVQLKAKSEKKGCSYLLLAFMWRERKCKMKARYCRGKNWADKEEMNNTIQW